MSPRNSVEAICSMLEASNCRRIVVQPLTAPLAAAAQTKMASKGVSLALVDLPSIHTVFPGSFGSDTDQPLVATPYPPRPTPGDPDRPTKYIHSSGSTGLPKTVPLSDRLQWRWAMQCKLAFVAVCSSPSLTSERSCDLWIGHSEGSPRIDDAADIPPPGILGPVDLPSTQLRACCCRHSALP